MITVCGQSAKPVLTGVLVVDQVAVANVKAIRCAKPPNGMLNKTREEVNETIQAAVNEVHAAIFNLAQAVLCRGKPFKVRFEGVTQEGQSRGVGFQELFQ